MKDYTLIEIATERIKSIKNDNNAPKSILNDAKLHLEALKVVKTAIDNNISLDDLFNEYVEKARNLYKTNHPKLGEKHLLVAKYIKNQKTKEYEKVQIYR